MTLHVRLRPVVEVDLPIFFEHQRDPESVAMAVFPARDAKAHAAHWTKIMADRSTTLRTILDDEVVCGNIVSWDGAEGREVGYWLGREFWGRGIATQALKLFLKEVAARPLTAHVARHNVGSRRVLEKCGFAVVRSAIVIPEPGAAPISELTLQLD